MNTLYVMFTSKQSMELYKEGRTIMGIRDIPETDFGPEKSWLDPLLMPRLLE